MTYIKLNEHLYPADRIIGAVMDAEWDYRESRSITLTMTYEEADSLFVDNIAWSIVNTTTSKKLRVDANGATVLDSNGQVIYDDSVKQEEFDCSDYCVAGALTNNRDGTITVKMGKMTPLEQAYELLLGGIGV